MGEWEVGLGLDGVVCRRMELLGSVPDSGSLKEREEVGSQKKVVRAWRV